MDNATTTATQQQRVREFTLLIAQLAAQYEMSDGELAAAAGGACAVGRLLRRVTAQEDGIAIEEAAPLSVMPLALVLLAQQAGAQ